MWGSSKYQKSNESQEFDAYKHFTGLSNDNNIEFMHEALVSYPIGWNVLMIVFMNEVKHYPVALTEVSDRYGQLEIMFEMKSGRNEVKVWRLVNKLRLESRHTCMECGNLKDLFEVPGTRKRICKECFKTSNDSTGTWLDKY